MRHLLIFTAAFLITWALMQGQDKRIEGKYQDKSKAKGLGFSWFVIGPGGERLIEQRDDTLIIRDSLKSILILIALTKRSDSLLLDCYRGKYKGDPSHRFIKKYQ